MAGSRQNDRLCQMVGFGKSKEMSDITFLLGDKTKME
jgi:hypothetical protein